MERSRSITILVGVLLSSAATVAVSSVPPAAAQSPNGSFACRASAVDLLGVEPVVANPGGGPCPTETRSVLDAPVGSLAVRAATTRTSPLPGGGGATSRAQVIGIDLASFGIRADVVEAEATVACEGDRPRLVGTSRVVGLTVNGRTLASAEAAIIPLPVGTLHLNESVLEGDALSRRALCLETPLGSVVLGEARVGFAGSPCMANGTITFEVLGDTRLAYSFTGDVGTFSVPGGRSAGASRRSFSKPAGRYRIRQLDPPNELVNPGGKFPYVINHFLDGLRCEDPDGGTTTDLGDSRADVDLDPGENVICFFTNASAAALAANADIDNPTRGLPGAGGFVQNPSAGLTPVSTDQSPGSRSQAGVEPPSAPRPGSAGDGGDGGGDPFEGISASILSGSTLMAIPTLAILFAAGLGYWLLAAGRRRRKDEEEEPA